MDRKLKAYMKSNGLQVEKNIASGELQGHVVTFSKGKGYVQIHLATYFQNSTVQEEFEESLDRKLMSRDYRVLELKFLPDHISTSISYRSAKDLEKLESYVNYLFPLLVRSAAVRSDKHTPVQVQNQALYKTALSKFFCMI